MKIKHGASFGMGLFKKAQEQRQARRENRANQADTGSRPLLNKMFGKMNPNSNGTGSGRPNFGPFAQKAIGGVMGGQQMGDAMGFRQGVNQKLDQVLSKLDPAQADSSAAPAPAPAPQDAPMPPADPMNDNNAVAKSPAEDPSLMAEDAAGASMGIKPKKKAKAEAKAYADKHGIRGKARKEMVKEAKKSRSFDAETNSQSKATAEANKEVNFGGSMNGGPGGRKKPTEIAMKSDATRNEIRGVQQMKGEFAGIERRPASVDFPNQSASSNRDLDFKRMMNRDNAEMWAKGGGGIYSDKYAKQRLHDSGYDMVSRPGPLNKTGQTIAKGPKKPKAKPQSEMKMLRSVKALEPKKKFMATKTVAKLKKKPLQKMTPRPAKKL